MEVSSIQRCPDMEREREKFHYTLLERERISTNLFLYCIISPSLSSLPSQGGCLQVYTTQTIWPSAFPTLHTSVHCSTGTTQYQHHKSFKCSYIINKPTTTVINTHTHYHTGTQVASYSITMTVWRACLVAA